MKRLFLLLLALWTVGFTMPVQAENAWNIDTPMASIPNIPLSGSLFGTAIDSNNLVAQQSNNVLTLGISDTQKGQPLAQISIFLKFEDGKNTREWVITPWTKNMPPQHVPLITMQVMLPGNASPSELKFAQAYSMRLNVQRNGDVLQGQIHLSLPDYKKSYLIGTFKTEPQR